MPTIPRKIEPEKIKGYIYCLDFGPLAYENDDDKQKLIALSELYREGIKAGGLRVTLGGLPQSTWKIKASQFEALQVLWHHSTKNPLLDLKTQLLMKAIAKKKKKEIVVFTEKELRKLGKGWLSRLKFWKK